MAKEKFYITTAIIYANARPHIGHALEFVVTDALARWHRLLGKDVYFLTGADEHGLKILNAAELAKVAPQEFVDQNVAKVRELLAMLNVSNTEFIRTTDTTRHWPAATRAWEVLAGKGKIYLGHYQGYYSITDEAYIAKADFESGAYDPTKVIELAEDNYMFKLSDFSDQLRRVLGKELQIFPAHRAKEMLNFIDTGLTDVSFSRPHDKLPWGIPVPGDPTQVMYVWCDALTNYISAIGYGRDEVTFQKYWPADIHVIGKDIIRFHSIIWPAMLMALELPLPKRLLVHGHVLSEGKKMSKSVGNVVDPFELVQKYGSETTRYYLLKEIPTLDDGDFSHARLEELYESDLANDLGNLLNRSLNMADKFMEGKITQVGPDILDTPRFWSEYASYFEDLEVDKAAKLVWAEMRKLNQFIDQVKPWEKAKVSLADTQSDLCSLIESLRHIAIAIRPMLPVTSDIMLSQLGLAPIDEASFNFSEQTKWGGLESGHQLGTASALFPRLS